MDQAKDFSSDEKNRRIGDINKSFTKCKEYGDDKLSLAMQVRFTFWRTPAKRHECIGLSFNFSSIYHFRLTIWSTNTYASWTLVSCEVNLIENKKSILESRNSTWWNIFFWIYQMRHVLHPIPFGPQILRGSKQTWKRKRWTPEGDRVRPKRKRRTKRRKERWPRPSRRSKRCGSMRTDEW